MVQRDVVVAGRCLITSLGPPSSTYSRTARRRHGWETDWTSASGRVSVPICKRRRERAVDQPAAPPKTNRASWPSPPLLRLASRPLLGASAVVDSGSLSTVDGGPEDDGRTSFAAGLAQTTKKTKTMARSSPSWYRPAGLTRKTKAQARSLSAPLASTLLTLGSSARRRSTACRGQQPRSPSTTSLSTCMQSVKKNREK